MQNVESLAPVAKPNPLKTSELFGPSRSAVAVAASKAAQTAGAKHA